MNQHTYRGGTGQIYGLHTRSGEHYVYQHRNPVSGYVFYVGLGKFNRCNQKNRRNKYWKNYTDKHGIVVEIVRDGLSRADAIKLEKKLIRELKPSCNFSAGGEAPLRIGFPVHAFTKDGVLFKSFPTISEANAFFKVLPNDGRICRCLNGKRRAYKGFLWSSCAKTPPKHRPRKHAKAKQVHQYNLDGAWVASFDSPRQAKVPTRTGIYGVLDKPQTYSGSFWRSFKATCIFDKPPTASLRASREVICHQTGVIYGSVSKAAKAKGMNHQTLSKKLRGTLINNTGLQFYAK